MKSQAHSNSTFSYYNKHAEDFCRRSVSLDMGHLYDEFLPLLPKGGKILDAGCGSGRDIAFFKRQGFTVTAFDASEELSAIASKSLGESVKVMSFLDLEFTDEFDGVWACASLLHLPSSSINEGIRRLALSLKVSGVFYASFKYGDFEGVRDDRFFNDFTEKKMAKLLTKQSMLQLRKIWKTTTSRPEGEQECWLNVIFTRT